jgi:Gram-negative bacterial TonB protein C-terminal
VITSTARLLAALTLVAVAPGRCLAQESVQSAQALYASAAYDEALAVLDRLRAAELSPSEVRAINQQRALCLLALGRAQDADQAITAVVQADPAYRPDGTSTSPRVRAAFRDVRARLLPGIVQAEYTQARRLYDEEAWADAATAFQRVATLAADPDLGEAQIAALADVRVLADGFAKLSEAAATPPPPPPPPAPEPAPAEPPAPVIDYAAVFDGSTPGVVPPVTLRQDLPRWVSAKPAPRATGELELIITAQGVIERATLVQPIATFYDRQVLDATKNWRYRPASLNGQPVRYRKTIKIAFQ